MNISYDLATLDAHAEIVHREFAPTPQYKWPLLCERLGTDIWLKHENHTPTGAFKVRGGLVYFKYLKETRPDCPGVVSATRGNHGLSVGYAAQRCGLPATIVVPHGNSREKNAAMRGLGVHLVEHGTDYQESREHAIRLGDEKHLHSIPPFHPWLLLGVASYCLEFLRALPELEVVYVPIGMGSGACSMIAARDALQHKAQVVGVVSSHAPAYKLSLEAGRVIEHAANTQIADGMACRVPDQGAFDMLRRGLARVAAVSDEEVAGAMKSIFTDTHNAAEGAGAAAFAAALQERDRVKGKKVGAVLTGANVDAEVFGKVLNGP
ncbi:MAG: threonine dehydratase [Betaproteobacteria bacterium]|nr:threonine dehydratase [Betaproteobacteria bacterium]